MVAAAQSVIELYPYQREIFRARDRVIVDRWCRQSGKDFWAACHAVDDAIATGQQWFIVSLSQRQADATFAKCRQVADIFKRALKVAGRITESEGGEYLDYDAEIEESFRCVARTLHLPGGGSVTSLPGKNPDTLAGLTGNVIFTEFGLFPRGGYDHWRVVFPLATRGFQIVVISTPRGRNTKFFDLCEDADKQYRVSVVDIHRAVADGMPLAGKDGTAITIEEFRRLYNDEAGWQREYLCQFCGDLEALLKWAQILEAGTRNQEPGTSGDPGAPGIEFRSARIQRDGCLQSDFYSSLRQALLTCDRTGRLECGWDVARHGHLSSLAVNFNPQNGLPRRLVRLVTMKDVSFAVQREVVTQGMEVLPNSVGCGDATGLGMDSNETLHARYGDRWQPVTFTSGAKRDLASNLKTAFDDHDQLLPPAEGPTKNIATDLYALQVDNTGGQLQLIESVNPLEPDSHCDIAWSIALMRRAATLSPALAQLFTGVD